MCACVFVCTPKAQSPPVKPNSPRCPSILTGSPTARERDLFSSLEDAGALFFVDCISCQQSCVFFASERFCLLPIFLYYHPLLFSLLTPPSPPHFPLLPPPLYIQSECIFIHSNIPRLGAFGFLPPNNFSDWINRCALRSIAKMSSYVSSPALGAQIYWGSMGNKLVITLGSLGNRPALFDSYCTTMRAMNPWGPLPAEEDA